MATWFITGAARGLGRAIAEALLARGDNVAGTCRKAEDKAALDALAPGRAIGIQAEVTDRAAVFAAIADAEARFGAIDYLVCNAGYGLVATVEEAQEQEIRDLFEVNFFGAVNSIQAVLPHMRARRAGHIVAITSVSGLAPWGGFGIYGASKHALEGLCQCLAQEVGELGIGVTNVAPGAIATHFDGDSIRKTPNPIDDYAGAGHNPRRVYAQPSKKGKADPADVARAIVEAVTSDNPPLHLLLGADAFFYAGDKAAQFQAEISRWAPVTLAVSPQVKAGKPVMMDYH